MITKLAKCISAKLNILVVNQVVSFFLDDETI